MFLPGTLTRFVIEGYREKCETKTVLGARFAKHPIELDIPIYITGMSFGALSLEAKMALAKGASMAGTATCSGEGGMIPPERDLSTKWYYQNIQSRYGFNPHHLMLADACEFFIGQGCKVGLGGHLMGQKVTEQVAEMRSLPAGIDQRSPARHPDWLGPDDLSLKVQEVREATDYRIPIQLKLGAARVYDDVRMAAKCGPDIIYLDGAEGSTGAGPHIAAEETGIPLMAAIPEARRALEDVGLADEVDLVVAGGIRNGADVAKCLALGATAVAIGHSALMALNCNKEIPGVTDYEGTVGVPAGQCYHCHTGRCPVGITTQDPELRKRLEVDPAAERVYNFLTAMTMELQMLARACGKTDVHSLEPEDLCALTMEAAAMAKVPLAGTDYIPGVTDKETLEDIKTMMQKYLADTGQFPAETTDESQKGRHERAAPLDEDRDRRRGARRPTVPVPGGHLPRGGRRPGRAHTGPGPELARGRHAPAGGRRGRGVRSLLELVPEDLLRHPSRPGGRARPQGADEAPDRGELVRDPAEGEAREVPATRARTLGRGIRDGGDGLDAAGAGGLGTSRRPLTRRAEVRSMTDGRPLVAISEGFADYGDYYGYGYGRPLLAAGALPVLLPYYEREEDRVELIERIDGLVLAGGRDIEAWRYGRDEPHPKHLPGQPFLDEIDLSYALLAVEDEVPVLGVCRGCQILNVALGGTLYGDLEEFPAAGRTIPGRSGTSGERWWPPRSKERPGRRIPRIRST